MPKWTTLVAGWVLAAVAAVALSWSAVAQVRNRVIQPSTPIPATTLTAQEPVAPVATTTTATSLELEPSTATSLPRPYPAVITQPPAPTVPTDVASSPPTPTTTTAASAPATTTTTTIPVSTTTTTQPPPTTTTSEAPAAPQANSYQLVGGTVTISYTPGVVTFVSAIPQSGYSTEIEESGPSRVRVHFESDSHTSEFRAEWEGAELAITKSEEDQD